MSESIPFTPPTVEKLNELLPHYDVLAFIAEGGMGAVYMAEETATKQRVAIKILPQELCANPEYNKAFREEAEVMEALNHPNLIKLYNTGEVDGMLFIVVEYIEGKALHFSAYKSAIDQQVALGITIGMCAGVAHAHRAGIIHRDLKPANILLNKDGTAKVGDFGLARQVGKNESSKLIFGTPGYTAPEVLSSPTAVGKPSDVFSIGVILYELLTGELPEENEYLPLSTYVNGNDNLDAILKKALNKRPQNRYADAGEMLKKLKEAQVILEASDETGNQIVSGHETVLLSQSKQVTSPLLETSSTPILKANIESAENPTLHEKPSNKSSKVTFAPLKIAAVLVLLGAIWVTSILLKKNQDEVKESVAVIDTTLIEKVEPKEKPKKVEPTEEEKIREFLLKIDPNEASSLPENTLIKGARKYLLVKYSCDWNTAKELAELGSGHLAVITSSKEQAALVSEVILKVPMGQNLWLGGDFHREKITWITGENASLERWLDGYPKFEISRKIQMLHGDKVGWVDARADDVINNYGFIIEWSDDAKTVERKNSSKEESKMAHLPEEIQSLILKAKDLIGEIEPSQEVDKLEMMRESFLKRLVKEAKAYREQNLENNIALLKVEIKKIGTTGESFRKYIEAY